MNTTDLIGRTITNIFVWSKMEVGGLDEAEVAIQLDNNKIVEIPWDFESENIERQPRKDSKSLLSNLDNILEYHVNPQEKTIEEILISQKKRDSSIWGKLKKIFGFRDEIPKEYKPYRITLNENKSKYLLNQKIVDFLMFDNFDSVGFLELGNGFIITETMMSPHGTGLAGLNLFNNLNEFEHRYGTNYKRLSVH